MIRSLFPVVSIIIAISHAIATPLPYPVGDVRNCLPQGDSSSQLKRMQSLPGVGFDNLRNMEMSAVVQYNYSLCKTTNDDRFLIPDDILIIPIQRSRIDSYATLYDHWDDYVSMTSASINVGATVYSAVSGKFGFEYQHVKQHQVNNAAKTTRTQMRTSLYKVILEPDAQLNPKFKSRLLDIAANIQNNNTAYAAYLVELLVRDYGSHVLRSVEVGAVIGQIDSISSEYVTDKHGNIFNLTRAAAVSLSKKLSLSVSSSFGYSQEHLNEYLSNRYHSQIVSEGGPMVHPNMSIEEWETGVYDALVPIDRSGDPLHFVITSVTLPELPSPILRDLVDYVYKGVEMYYSVNTHYGCTDPTSNNFDYHANLDDKSCASPPTNYTFGGVFQTCEKIKGKDEEDLCKKYGTKNPLTGNYTCPEGYMAIELHSGVATHVKKEKKCKNVCHHSGFLGISRKCTCLSVWKDVLISAKYQAYWCASVDSSDLEEGSGALFGGVYTTKNMNPATRSMTCPFHFYPLQIGLDLKVCISTQFQNAFEFSVPFGGFTSCKSGNPLSTSEPSGSGTYPKHCPSTYRQFLATVDEGCEINYCAQMPATFEIQPPKIPPYHLKPGLKVNISQSMVIQGPYGNLWVRNEHGDWVSVDDEKMTGQEILEALSAGDTPSSAATTDDDDDEMSNGHAQSIGAIVGASIGSAILGAILAIIATVLGALTVRRYRKKKARQNVSSIIISRRYSSFEDQDNGDGNESKA